MTRIRSRHRFKDETGKVYGKLTVLRFDKTHKSQPFFICLCECGKQVSVRGSNLRTGNTTSCGCSRIKSLAHARGKMVMKVFHRRHRVWGKVDPTADKKTRWMIVCECGHFHFYTEKKIRDGKAPLCDCLVPTYISWRKMIERCSYEKHPHYKHYGGRGISVCKRWRRFYQFLEDMGRRPDGQTLDRINNDEGYCKDNCRWATKSEQSQNRRNVIKQNLATKTI